MQDVCPRAENRGGLTNIFRPTSSRNSAGGAQHKEAVKAPFGMFDAVGGKIGKPLAVGHVAELVDAVGQGQADLPPAVAAALHGSAADLPCVEAADDANVPDAAAEEAEFGLAGRKEVDHGWLV